MVTWREFKANLEAAGVTDDTKINLFDCNGHGSFDIERDDEGGVMVFDGRDQVMQCSAPSGWTYRIPPFDAPYKTK